MCNQIFSVLHVCDYLCVVFGGAFFYMSLVCFIVHPKEGNNDTLNFECYG